ncbi:MAG: hypothetical protein H0U71_03285 [Gammaproteobacteria bacterium]|nr:hypothetical protein [Gammaproteobacteria bacterium]
MKFIKVVKKAVSHIAGAFVGGILSAITGPFALAAKIFRECREEGNTGVAVVITILGGTLCFAASILYFFRGLYLGGRYGFDRALKVPKQLFTFVEPDTTGYNRLVNIIKSLRAQHPTIDDSGYLNPEDPLYSKDQISISRAVAKALVEDSARILWHASTGNFILATAHMQRAFILALKQEDFSTAKQILDEMSSPAYDSSQNMLYPTSHLETSRSNCLKIIECLVTMDADKSSPKQELFQQLELLNSAQQELSIILKNARAVSLEHMWHGICDPRAFDGLNSLRDGESLSNAFSELTNNRKQKVEEYLNKIRKDKEERQDTRQKTTGSSSLELNKDDTSVLEAWAEQASGVQKKSESSALSILSATMLNDTDRPAPSDISLSVSNIKILETFFARQNANKSIPSNQATLQLNTPEIYPSIDQQDLDNSNSQKWPKWIPSLPNVSTLYPNITATEPSNQVQDNNFISKYSPLPLTNYSQASAPPEAQSESEESEIIEIPDSWYAENFPLLEKNDNIKNSKPSLTAVISNPSSFFSAKKSEMNAKQSTNHQSRSRPVIKKIERFFSDPIQVLRNLKVANDPLIAEVQMESQINEIEKSPQLI